MEKQDDREDRKVFNFTEQPSIIQEIDRIAEEEGTSRPALIRRGIRLILAQMKANKEAEMMQTA